MKEKIIVQIRFETDTECGRYCDTLNYTWDEYQKLKREDIESEQNKRINKWVDRIKNPPAPIELTKEEYESMLNIEKERVEDIKRTMISKGFLSEELDGN